MSSESEKRKHARRQCQVPVVCKKGSIFDSSQTVDISKGGIGFISSTPIPIDTKMLVELDLKADGEPVLALGRVKWVSHVRNSECYRVGMTFQEISTDSRSRLHEHCTV